MEHLRACKLRQGKARPSNPRGPRAELAPEQLNRLFHVLIERGRPWIAVVALLQVSMGERRGCAIRCQVGWVQNLDSAVGRRVSDPTLTTHTTITTAYEFIRIVNGHRHMAVLLGLGLEAPPLRVL